MNTHTIINWNYPQPRRGIAGLLDRFLGPGTTPAEAWMQTFFSTAAAVALLAFAVAHNIGWTPLQYAVSAVLAFDIMGGVVTNGCSSAKRWYHRTERGPAAHFGFVAFHTVYVFAVAWLFRGLDWLFFAGVSLYLLGAAALILKTPLYLQRPLAFSLLVGAMGLNTYAFSPTPGLELFVPLLFLKLIVSHLLREEPYRPETEPSRPEMQSPRGDS